MEAVVTDNPGDDSTRQTSSVTHLCSWGFIHSHVCRSQGDCVEKGESIQRGAKGVIPCREVFSYVLQVFENAGEILDVIV